MTNACEKWRDQLVETALAGVAAEGLEKHLRGCKACSAELQALQMRLERMDALLPLVARGAQLAADFRARVLSAAEAATEKKGHSHWTAWALAGATVAAAAVLLLGTLRHFDTAQKIPAEELARAQKLAEWRAPSDTLLATPGQEILRTTPKLGESYLNVPVNDFEEE